MEDKDKNGFLPGLGAALRVCEEEGLQFLTRGRADFKTQRVEEESAGMEADGGVAASKGH